MIAMALRLLKVKCRQCRLPPVSIYPRQLGRALSTQPKRVIVAMSGGVDSSVAAYLLKKEGHDVEGVYMRNWDVADETGYCSADQDYADMQSVCKALGIRSHHVNFVSEYWNDVFSAFLVGYERGVTPNPDIFCNREIKFNAFWRHAKSLGAECVATGHYARTQVNSKGKAELLKAVDETKDQSYFLAAVPHSALSDVMFPLGNVRKTQVREIAAQAGLSVADKKDSTGICFVGKRDFSEFIDQYVAPKPGPIVTVDGRVVGEHQGIFLYTIGQRSRLSGHEQPLFVAAKDPVSNTVLVAPGRDHPALYSDYLTAERVYWVAGEPPAALANGRGLECQVRCRHQQPLRDAIATLHNGKLKILFTTPQWALTPGQIAAVYVGDVCLGGAVIGGTGPSYHELGRPVKASWRQP